MKSSASTRSRRYYYAPGWWEAGAQLSFYVGIKEWEKLPKEYQAAIEVAIYRSARVHAGANTMRGIRRRWHACCKNGIKLRIFSKDIMEACYKAAIEVMEEEASKNAKFKKIYEPWKRFRQTRTSGSRWRKRRCRTS